MFNKNKNMTRFPLVITAFEMKSGTASRQIKLEGIYSKDFKDFGWREGEEWGRMGLCSTREEGTELKCSEIKIYWIEQLLF